ncbi:MAG: hypothetical protein LLG06_03140 [Desulfobacteraceae bacterium]|nr:hypothetical protein [Desulfobacteraceae bacterium]
MTEYVWCKNDECRIPAFRCILCRHDCYEVRGRAREGEVSQAFEILRSSGKFKEHFIMKRKDNLEAVQNQLSFFAEKKKEQEEMGMETNESENGSSVFLLEDGKIKPFSEDEYTASTLYQAVDSFSVECRLVRPEEPGNLVFEGKKPTRKTVPILVKKNGECVMLNSWDELESQPSQLADARDVVGAVPVKKVFVLKRK